MTKNVRIENADTSYTQIVVFVEGLGDDGKWHRLRPGIELNNPTDEYIGIVYPQQRLVIEEKPL
jgi:hypothetical protein